MVNGAGAFTSVVSAVNLGDFSFSSIIEAFGNLPATSQAALVMAVLSAFPIGALVAGDGLAALALERRTTTDHREQAWQDAEFTVIYRALYGRYLQQGVPERDARQKASAEVRGHLGKGTPSVVHQLPSTDSRSSENGHLGQEASGQTGSIKTRVREYLDANPGLDQLSINQVLVTLKQSGFDVGRTTVADVLQERKAGN